MWAKAEIAQQRSSVGILNPCARWEEKYSEGRDFGDMGERRCRIPAGADLKQAVQVATVMEHALATYRDLLKVVPLANRESYQVLRAFVREWTLAQRKYGDLGRHTTPDTSAPMDTGQVKGTKRKGKKSKIRKGQEKGKGKKDNGEAKGNARTDDSCFAGECGVLWQVGTQESPVPEAEEGPRKQTTSCNSSSSRTGESSPVIWRERRLFLDTCRVCIVWTKRTNPGCQWCRRTLVPDELRVSYTSETGQGRHALWCTGTQD